MSSQPAVDVLIPAHNEEDALPVLIADIDTALPERRPIRRIVVVDNASTDHTAEVARESGCEVVSCPTPGYGAACLAGIAYIAEDPPEVLVFLDGDRSDYPEHLPQLVAPILANQADMVLGSRNAGLAEPGSLTLPQRFGNWLATSLLRLFWGARYSDLGPFRAIRWRDLTKLHMQDTNYGWTIEMQIKATLHQLRVQEIPIKYRPRIGVSKISGTVRGVVGAGYKILYTIFRYKWQTLTKPQAVQERS